MSVRWNRRRQESVTWLSTDEMGRVKKLGKHNIVVDTMYSAGTHQSRETEKEPWSTLDNC